MPATTPATRWRVFGWSGEPKRSDVQGRDRPRAHGEDVAQDAADARRRALVGLDEGGVVVALHLEDAGVPVADVDDAGVLARALDHPRRLRRQRAQVQARGLVGAVLVPHRRDDAELGQRRLAADEVDEALVFVRLEAVLLHELGGDVDVGSASLSHIRPAAGQRNAPQAAFSRDATRLSKRPRPSVPPTRSSIRFSGCGIMPSTFSLSE